MKFLIKLCINMLAIVITANILPGIEINNFTSAAVAGFVLAVLNAALRPLIIFITLPINIMSLGLLTLFINGFMLYLVSKLIKGLIITGFWPAFFGAILVSVISFIFNLMIGHNNIKASKINFKRTINRENVIDAEVVEHDQARNKALK